MEHGLHELDYILLLMLGSVVVFAQIARRINIAYPIVLVIGGLILSLIPGMPRFTLNPQSFFTIFLPPLLFHAAWNTSWREFRASLARIAWLAFGLTAFTVAGIAFAGEELFTALYWKTGLVLGAIVAPTDAIAASSIGKRLGLPRSITDLLEGESLINDATGLLAVQIGVASVVKDLNPTFFGALLQVAVLVIGGIIAGLIIGFVARWSIRYISDGPLTLAMSILAPYVAYLAAEAVHTSGVIAVVVAGLYMSRHASQLMLPSTRLQLSSTWEGFDFLLNGFVFAIIGLQLPVVLAGIQGYSRRMLMEDALAFTVILIGLRLLFVLPGSYLGYWVRKMFGRKPKKPSGKVAFVVGWTGMRGVISLAAALSLPLTLNDGTPFPARNLILFLTFVTILVTLVLQGLTLPPLIRALGLAGSDDMLEEQEARRAMLLAAAERLAELRSADASDDDAVYEEIGKRIDNDLVVLSEEVEPDLPNTQSLLRNKVEEEVNRAQRTTAIRLRDEGRINDEVLRRLERDIDLRDARMAAPSHH